MRVRVLGPTDIDTGAGVEPAALTFKQRALLAALVLHRHAAITATELIDQLWPSTAPRTAANTLQGYLSTLRRRLEPDRPPRAPAGVLVTVDDTYRLAHRTGASTPPNSPPRSRRCTAASPTVARRMPERPSND